MNRLGFYSVSIAISSLILNSGCTSKGRSGEKPSNSLVAPSLNESRTAKLARRMSTDANDNYAETCLYLSNEFKQFNVTSICVQNDNSLTGVQVVGQQAKFIRLDRKADLTTYSLSDGVVIGDRVPANAFLEGEVYDLQKSDSDEEYEIVFAIKKVDPSSVTIEYQVKSFRKTW